MPRIRVRHLASGRTLTGTPDELLEWLSGWWSDEEHDDGEIEAQITQVVYEWERGVFDGWRNRTLGVRAVLIAA